jgi:hypothetical protein
LSRPGPKPASREALKLFAHLYYRDLTALAEGRPESSWDWDCFSRETRELSKAKLTYGERVKIQEQVEREIRAQLLKEDARENTLHDLQTIGLVEKQERRREAAATKAASTKLQRGRPKTVQALLEATSVEQVRQICRSAFKIVCAEIGVGSCTRVRVENWPIDSGSMFPECLAQHAEQFIHAKNEPRFPRSERASSKKKKLWFYACSLAAAVLGIKTRTAINLLGSKVPSAEELARCPGW